MRKPLAAFGFYTLVTLAFMLPLLAHFGTHVVGDGSDDPALAWNLWWIKHAWLDLGTSPLSSDFIFYPIGINLAFYTLTLLNGALSLSLQAIAGIVPGANLLLVASFVLSGFGAYLLTANALLCLTPVESTGKVRRAALVAGVVYAFAANKWLFASLGQFNIASSQWIPFYALSVWRLGDAAVAKPVHRRRTARAVFLAALFLALQAYAEFTFASFLIVFTVFFALAHWRHPRLLAALAIVGGLFFVSILPILVPMARELAAEGDIFVEGSGFAEAFSVDVLGFVVPSRLHPIFGGVEEGFAFPYINFAFVGWVTLALGIVGAWSARRAPSARWWLAATVAFALISLGPDLRIGGSQISLPMPFEIFQSLPFFKGNRYPSRYTVMTMLGLAVFAGYGTAYLVGAFRAGGLEAKNRGAALRRETAWRRVPPMPEDTGVLSRIRRPLPGLLSALILFEHAAVLPLSDLRVPAYYSDIRSDPGDFTVLELPLAWRNGFRITGTLDKVFMRSQWYQTVHEKRMLSGNTSRNPELKFQYFTEAPVINSLIALETGHDLDAATLERDRALAPTVMRFLSARYIVLRPEAGADVGPYLEKVLPNLTLWREEPGARVYKLQHSPEPPGRVVSPQEPLARLYFAEGWGELGGERVWAQRDETRLLLPIGEAGQTLLLNYLAPDDTQTLAVSVNGVAIGTAPLSAGRNSITFEIPAGVAGRAVDDVRLQWSRLYSTASLESPDTRSHPWVVAKSAGNEVGDFAHIWVDGVDYSPNRRGYNFVWFGPTDTFLPAANAYDTFADTAASDALALNLEHNLGAAVALAVRDEGSRNLTARLLDRFASLGIRTKPGWRWSHAVVRESWSDLPVTLSEDASPIRPAIAAKGERVTSPLVAAAIERIELRPLVPGR